MNLLQSLKQSLRTLRKRPAFSAIIIFTFAIATGASIVVYSYMDALLFTSLPFKDPGNLVRIQSVKGGEKGLFSYPEFLDMQKQLTGIEELAVYRDGGRYNLSGDGKPPEDLTTTFASSNLFRVLGVEPQIGSYWPETLDERGSHTIMLTHDFWQKRFDGKESIDMLQVTLDGFTYTNYGVLPKGFSFPHRNEAFRAMAFADFVVDSRSYRPCIGLARLKPGVTLEDFNSELRSFAELQEQIHADTNLGISYRAEPLANLYIGELKGYIFLLGAAALFLLTIATVNVSNLILIQTIRKTKETVVRKVLGSSHSSIIINAVVHSMVLSLLGSLTGLLFAWGVIGITHDLTSPYLPHWIHLSLNQSVLVYAMLVALSLGVITGALPWIFNKTGKHLVSKLKEGQQTTGSKRQHRAQKGLATLQIIVCVVLMIGGLLLFKSFTAASKTDLGFITKNKMTFRLALSWFKYGSNEKKDSFFEKSLKQIGAIPGVEQVTLTNILPLSNVVDNSAHSQENLVIEGQSDLERSENPFISVQRVIPNYFDVMGVKIERGTAFDTDEYEQQRFQVVIDRHLADKMWPNGDALGQRIHIWGKELDRPYLQIVGIAENVKHQSVIGDNIPNVYISLYAYPHTDVHYIVQTSNTLGDLETPLKEAILSIDENQPTFEYSYVDDIVATKNWRSKVAGMLFLTLATIGSLIAVVGLFSVMTFILLLKVKELALRRVLGATDQEVVQLVLGEMLKIAGVGVGVGIVLSPILLRPINPFLFEVNLFDLSTYGLVIVGLLGASILATLMPFRSALTVNPAKVLRGE
ncbi:MAG: ABC transporter permease [Bacteroidota bacterium]